MIVQPARHKQALLPIHIADTQRRAIKKAGECRHFPASKVSRPPYAGAIIRTEYDKKQILLSTGWVLTAGTGLDRERPGSIWIESRPPRRTAPETGRLLGYNAGHFLDGG